jgi:hypothetical protein
MERMRPMLNEFPKTWDNSMRSMGKDCSRKLYFFLNGFEPKTSKAYFVWGSAFHLMMDKWYSSTDDSKTKVLEAIGEGGAYFDDNITEESPDNTRDGLITAFRYYIERYETDPFKMVQGASEQGFQWPLLGTDYFYAGSMDGYIHWEPYGFLVLEHKTTSEYLSDSFIGQWEFSPQVTGYHWYLSKLHENTYGVLVNMITKKVPGPRSNWSTPRVARTLVRKTEADLIEFETDVIRDINGFKTCYDTGIWPKTTNPRNCVGGPGRGACPFKQICLSQVDYHKVDISIYENLKIRDEDWRPWRRGND